MAEFKKVLIANRGEIAVRIAKCLRELGIGSVAVCSSIEKNALHVRIANESICIGDGMSVNSYLNSYNILSAALSLNVCAIHPGIGFFAEDGDFAESCQENGIVFIGPNKNILEIMGNKSSAKKVASSCMVPIVPGSINTINNIEECYTTAEEIGYPILLKATYGGGGKGIRSVKSSKEMQKLYNLCIQEAKSSFGKSDLLIEKEIVGFKHIEVQILADKYGNVIHLGDRECTIQRTKQKIIEEALCVNIPLELKKQLYDDAVTIAKKINFVGPGTIEFLVLPDNTYYFMEMNTRLQVEHTVTELIAGIDIVKEQIRIFEGKKLEIKQTEVEFKGYALQCRIIAEDSENKFLPSFGEINKWNMPSGPGVRVDLGYGTGSKVTPYYDSLIAKICCIGTDKKSAISKMLTCLDEIEISGIATNISLLKKIISTKEFQFGDYTETFVDKVLQYSKGE